MDGSGASKELNDKISLRPIEVYHILWPYFWEKLREQVTSLVPIVGYLFLFQILVLQMAVYDSFIISVGLIGVLLGLAFFLEGLKLGLMPFGEIIGVKLPEKSTVPIIIAFAFLLGIGATLAEPAIGTLKLAGVSIDPMEAPLLYALLTKYSNLLVMAVGIGVGLATVLGTLRFLCNWSLKIFIFPLLPILMVLTVWATLTPELASIVGLAWDCGAVTTGPVTVPLVLALGIGITRATGKGDTGMSGFGIVTLASIFPIIAVLLLGFYLNYSGADLSVDGALALGSASGGLANFDWSTAFVDSLLMSLRAIVPLCIFLFCVLTFVLKEKIKEADEIGLGIAFTVFGMMLFGLGLTVGLTPLGSQVGFTVPGAFSEVLAGSPPELFGPLYGSTIGKLISIAFGFFLGYGATMAEPALNALGVKVEDLTVGAFKKSLLIQAVSVGVGVGIAMGVIKIIFNIPIAYMLIPPYVVVLVLTYFSSERFVNIGWDSAGVTTGPITVPLVIATGLGIGANIPGVVEGFGILCLASVWPIMSVLSLGLIVGKEN